MAEEQRNPNFEAAPEECPSALTVVPVATCVCAAALWAGCALAEATGWCVSRYTSAALALSGGAVIAAIVMAMAAAILAGNRAFRVAPRYALVALAISALLLGVTLRCEQAIKTKLLPNLDLPEDGTLVRLEATLVAPFEQRARRVDLLAKYLPRSVQFQALAEDVVLVSETGARTPIGDPHARIRVTVRDARPDFRAEDRIEVTGVLRGLPGGRLPNSERAVEYLGLSGIVGFVSVDSPALIRCIEDSMVRAPVHGAAKRLREVVRTRLREALLSGVPDDGSKTIRSMLVALVLGDTEDGYHSVEESFREVGLAHILAISGFNLAVLGWIVGLATGFITRDTRIRALAVGCAALAALILMTPAASAIRSCLMAIVGATGGAFGRDWNGDAVLSIAAVVMLLHDPSDCVNPGFQLSFGCVLALRHLSSPVRTLWLNWIPADDPRNQLPVWVGIAGEFLSRSVASGCAAFLASVPVVLAHFGSMQPYAVPLTLLCAPLSTVTLASAYPKAVIGSIWPPIVAPLGPLLWLFAWLQVKLVELASDIGAGSIPVGKIHWTVAGAVLVCVVGALRLRRRDFRAVAWMTSALIVALACSRAQRPVTHAPLTCTMFAIGDGTSIALEIGTNTVLFDGGSSSMGDVASRVLVPWIVQRGGLVNAVFISHPNIDHLSALADVARLTRIERAYVHPSFIEAASTAPAIAKLLDVFRERSTEIITIAKGDCVRIGDSVWTVLWPDAGFRSRRENDLSLVVTVELDQAEDCSSQTPNPRARGGRLLLSGDIETEPSARLAAMAARDAVDLRCDVAELPHHGSWREAIVGYLKAADPAFILQSTARRRFAADRFATHLPTGSQRLVTCRDGSIRVDLETDGTVAAFVYDPYARENWRPIGRAERRERRPRSRNRIKRWWRRQTLVRCSQLRRFLRSTLQGHLWKSSSVDARITSPAALDHQSQRPVQSAQRRQSKRVVSMGAGLSQSSPTSSRTSPLPNEARTFKKDSVPRDAVSPIFNANFQCDTGLADSRDAHVVRTRGGVKQEGSCGLVAKSNLDRDPCIFRRRLYQRKPGGKDDLLDFVEVLFRQSETQMPRSCDSNRT